MKYVLYIDYSASYKPMCSEYRKLEAKTLTEAILEADAQYDPDTMYLLRIMTKAGKAEKVETDIKCTEYRAEYERRTRWAKYNGGYEHIVGYYKAPFAEWFERI